MADGWRCANCHRSIRPINGWWQDDIGGIGCASGGPPLRRHRPAEGSVGPTENVAGSAVTGPRRVGTGTTTDPNGGTGGNTYRTGDTVDISITGAVVRSKHAQPELGDWLAVDTATVGVNGVPHTVYVPLGHEQVTIRPSGTGNAPEDTITSADRRAWWDEMVTIAQQAEAAARGTELRQVLEANLVGAVRCWCAVTGQDLIRARDLLRDAARAFPLHATKDGGRL